MTAQPRAVQQHSLQQPPSISLCMIVKNEAPLLPRCLNSVKEIATEMVVVDTGSSDRTVEIARQFGAKVYDWVWQDDFAAARNYGLQHLCGDWVLVLDADETLIADAIPALLEAVQDPHRVVIALMRHEVGAQQNPYSLLSRLFRNHPALRFERPYHESIDDSVTELIRHEPQWTIASLTQPAISHEGYRPDAIATRQKAERAERIMAAYFKTHPQDAYIGSKLGALYITNGAHSQGLTLLQQSLPFATSPAVIYELHYHLGLAYRATGQLDLAQYHYQQALAVDYPDPLKLAAAINLASLCADQGRWTQAQEHLEQILQQQPNLAIAHYNLGFVHKSQGHLLEAIQAYQKAIELDPQMPTAHQNLGVVYLKAGHIDASLAAFRQAIALYERQNSLEASRLRQTLAELGWSL